MGLPKQDLAEEKWMATMLRRVFVRDGRVFRILPLCACMIILALFLAVLTSLALNYRNAPSVTQCKANITFLAHGTFRFLDSPGRNLGCLPPPFITDASGKPLYSWRVVVAASCGFSGTSLVGDFDYTKPWDDPHNLDLLTQDDNEIRIHSLFTCPCVTHAKKGQVDYFFSLSVKDRWPRDFFFDDKSPPRIRLVEAPGFEVYWSEPVDFLFDKGSASPLIELRNFSAPHHFFYAARPTNDVRSYLLKIPGKSDPSLDPYIAEMFERQNDAGFKERTDALTAKLMEILREDPSIYADRVRALLLLGEMGPQARNALPLIREVIHGGDARLARIGKFAATKIEKN